MSKPKKQKIDSIKKLQNEIKQDTSDEIEVNSDDSEIISKKKVVYIEIDDELNMVFEKVKQVNAKHVYIVVPQRAVIFQSVVNLKILKRKANEENKKIYFITNDKNGIYLAEQVGIPIYDKTSEDKPSLFSTSVNDDKLRITPLKATVNAVEEEEPLRLAERKLSISEILRKNKDKKALDVSKINQANKQKLKQTKPRFVVIAPNRHALIGLIVLSVFILLTIVYIALPGATIYLTPQASVLEKAVNITLADYQKNRIELETHPFHMIASYPVSVTIDKTITHYSTGKKMSNRGANSKGKITIFNTSENDWPLIAKTRFQNNDGLVFRILAPVVVPKATANGPGKLEAMVVADEVDAYGQVVGERGNIPPARFFLPGLREDSRKYIYAESKEAMSGGITDYVPYVAKEDIETAKTIIKDEVTKAAIAALEKAVADKNKIVESTSRYILLKGDKSIKVGDVKITIDPALENKEVRDFPISGEVIVSGIYYDSNEMLKILQDELMMKKSPQKELLKINDQSITYQIFEWDDLHNKVKVTANIKGIEQFSIDPSTENGQRLSTKIKEHITGKGIEEAKLYIQNLPEINKVDIESWPYWAPTIPNLPDNIQFEIRDAVNVK